MKLVQQVRHNAGYVPVEPVYAVADVTGQPSRPSTIIIHLYRPSPGYIYVQTKGEVTKSVE